MGAYNDMNEKLAGLKYGFHSRDESAVAKEAIEFGRPVMGYMGDDVGAYNFHLDQDLGTFSGDLVTANVINGTINGVAITEVPFNATHDLTMADLLAEVLAHADVDFAELTDIAGDNRIIRIVTKGAVCVSVFVVTLGAGQVTYSAVSSVSTELEYLGVARFEQKESAGLAEYAIGDTVNIMTQGQLYAVTGEAVEANTDAYIRTADGLFGISGFATDGRFKETVAAAGLSRLYVGGENG